MLEVLGSGCWGLNMRCFSQAVWLGRGSCRIRSSSCLEAGCKCWLVSSSCLMARSSAVAVSSDCKGLGVWLRGFNRTCFCQAAWQGFRCVVVKLLGFEVCGSNLYLLGGMSGRRLAMPRGLPSLRWSTEPKRRKIVVVAGVEEATCSSTSAPCVSQPIPKFGSGRSGAPLLRPSTRGIGDQLHRQRHSSWRWMVC